MNSWYLVDIPLYTEWVFCRECGAFLSMSRVGRRRGGLVAAGGVGPSDRRPFGASGGGGGAVAVVAVGRGGTVSCRRGTTRGSLLASYLNHDNNCK